MSDDWLHDDAWDLAAVGPTTLGVAPYYNVPDATVEVPPPPPPPPKRRGYFLRPKRREGLDFTCVASGGCAVGMRAPVGVERADKAAAAAERRRLRHRRYDDWDDDAD